MNETCGLKTISTSETFRERWVLIVIICLHFSLLLAMGLFRHWGNMSNIHDLGVFDQAVWGTLHGQWFLHTIDMVAHPINWLSYHFNLFLLLFVPLYAIWPAAEWFALAQALALSVAAWPIFLIASRVHGSERIGLLWAVIYLLNPFLLSAAAWDFHPVTLAVPIIAGTLLAVEKKSFHLLVICCLCLLIIQEQFGITVAGFGALWCLKNHEWRRGLLLIGIGALYTGLVLGFIMPALSPSGTLAFIDLGSQYSRYGWIGGSPLEIFGNIILHPLSMMKTVVSMPGTVSYFVSLALPLLGLFFAAPVWLLPAIADLAANTLSAVSMPRSIISYHSVTLVPILTVSAIYGARRITPLLAKFLSVSVTKLVLLLMLVLCYTLAPLPLPGALNFWQPVQWIQTPSPALNQISALIAKSSLVSIQANTGAHFSQHQRIYRYPYKVGEADTIVLWLDSPTVNRVHNDRQAIGTIAHHLQMKPATFLASVECLLQDPVYRVVLWNEPWLVFSREPRIVTPDKSILNRLSKLRYSWQITSNEYEAALQECRSKVGIVR